jgi:hypothetical protein
MALEGLRSNHCWIILRTAPPEFCLEYRAMTYRILVLTIAEERSLPKFQVKRIVFEMGAAEISKRL